MHAELMLVSTDESFTGAMNRVRANLKDESDELLKGRLRLVK